ncbi:MAG: nucleoside triphosphate pyrophosphohydrolase [Candidatus Aenigmarchaeota archaeon]|nr:nucleoside triphosphate pyrophosphohydrolase [Candidatus Aenigmarchaeota archaeon]
MKLVRDNVPDIMKEKGENAEFRQASEEEYKQLLKKKLVEEALEFQAESKTEELADVLEVLHALAEASGTVISEIEEIRKAKREERGGFSKRIVLERWIRKT